MKRAMNYGVLILMMVLSSCAVDDQPGNSASQSSDISQASPARRSPRQKNLAPSDTVFRMKRWEFIWPSFSFVDWGPICGGVIEYPMYPQMVLLPFPEPVSVFAFDSLQYRDSITDNPGDFHHTWLLDDTLAQPGEYHWTHRIWNNGSRALRNISVTSLSECAEATLSDSILYPGDSAEVTYTVKCSANYMAYDFRFTYTIETCYGENCWPAITTKDQRYFMKHEPVMIQY